MENLQSLRLPHYIRPLNSLNPDSVLLFGGKAVNLGRVAQAGIQVPEGFALSTKLFSLYLNANSFPFKPEEYLSKNDQIREFILEGDFPSILQQWLKKIYQQVTTETHTCVVRSSAPYEDLHNHSMAGIFSSYIRLASYSEFEEAIKACYASLFTDKALTFLLEEGFDLYNLQMAIIVQPFIEGHPSGVIFTADTINMDENIVILNAVDSICAYYVDGSLPSAFYRIEKSTGKVIESSFTDFAFRDVDRLQLLTIALQIEELMEGYQDIEWTMVDDKVWILQTRPVTTFFKAPQVDSPTSTEVWSLVEPAPLAPLLQDILLRRAEGKRKGAVASGKNEPFYQFVHGYSYSCHLPRNPETRQAFLRQLEELANKGQNIFQDVVLPQIIEHHELLNPYIERSVLRKSVLVVNHSIIEDIDILEAKDFFQLALEFLIKAEELHWLAIDGHLYLETFEKYCQDRLGLGSADFYDLVYQTSRLSLERGQVMEMARYVKSDEGLLALFHQHQYDKILFAHLSNSSAGVVLLEQIATYLKDFGLFPVKGQWTLAARVLLEAPEEVLAKIRVCLDIDLEAYHINIKNTLKNKERLMNEILAGMPEKLERDTYCKMLEAAEKSFLVNDDHCYYLDMTACGYLRLALMNIGRQLVSQGNLTRWDDIFFLRLAELDSLLTTGNTEVCQLVGERKLALAREKSLIPPDTIGGHTDICDIPSPSNPTQIDTHILRGISGLKKKVIGKVKVITNNIAELTLTEDCILVLKHGHACYFLPLLNHIKGLIYDYGSPFDHPGIIAQELGIPSIYQTTNATKVLYDGDEVEIDGITGVVKITRKIR